MPNVFSIPINDIVSEYYWRIAENNPLAEIVLSAEEVLHKHIVSFLKPLCGYCSIADFLANEELNALLVNLRLPPEAARDHIQYVINRMQVRAVEALKDLPLYTHWYCELHPIPNNYYLTFYGGRSDQPKDDDRLLRRSSGTRQDWNTFGHQPFTGPGVYGPMLPWMGNAAVARQRRIRRFEAHDRKLSESVPDADDGTSGAHSVRSWPISG